MNKNKNEDDKFVTLLKYYHNSFKCVLHLRFNLIANISPSIDLNAVKKLIILA